MPSLSKANIIKTVRHHVGTNFLRRYLKDQLGPKTKCKTLDAAIGVLDHGFTKEEVEEFIFDNFFSMKHHTFVFETDDGSTYNKTTLAQILRKISLELDEDLAVIQSTDAQQYKISGYAVTEIKAQKFDDQSGQYQGQAKAMEALIPFQVIFDCDAHAKLKVSKFVPATFEDNEGNELKVLKNLFDEHDFASFILQNVVNHVCTETFVTSNLTTGIKALVQANRIGTVLAIAQDTNGGYLEQRTINRRPRHGIMVEQAWFKQFFYQSPRIGTSKWYWLDTGTVNPESTQGLAAHTVDAVKGRISQDTFADKNLEDLVNEVIENNV